MAHEHSLHTSPPYHGLLSSLKASLIFASSDRGKEVGLGEEPHDEGVEARVVVGDVERFAALLQSPRAQLVTLLPVSCC